MIKELIYIIEILSVLKCIHCVYGEKQKVNVGFIVTVIFLFGTIKITNFCNAPIEGTFLMYCILTIYCILVFKKSLKELIINTAIYVIVTTMFQLVFWAIFMLFIKELVLLRSLLADLSVLIVCYSIMPLIKLHVFAQWAIKKNVILYISTTYIFMVIVDFLMKLKINGNAKVGPYVFLSPFFICLYLVTKQWKNYQTFYEDTEKELKVYVEDKDKFEGLVANIRSRQHEMNNHLTAIMAMRYTEKSYEEFVKAQDEYCKKLLNDNKYNSLLSLYNSILPGYLLDKFYWMEEKGIRVVCKISVKKFRPSIPDYYLVEMVGILLDNAAEAVLESIDKKEIYFEIMETQCGFAYIVRNPHPYVAYECIESWFDFEESSKGPKRGIGLYHLKCLCKEWHCIVTCNNVEYNQTNHIEFKLETGRKV